MPRPKLPPRLILRPARQSIQERSEGKYHNVWVIRDGQKYIRTGCTQDEIEAAERELQNYIGEKHEPRRKGGKAAELSVGDILTVYGVDKAGKTARPRETLSALERLNDFWGDMSAAEIIGANCRAFVEHRGTRAGARRDLETLRAAVRHYKAEYGMEFAPVITLPPKGGPRERWLTREEAAALLNACRTKRRRHLARFILIGLYTATRHRAILGLQWHANTVSGWFDLDSGHIYRRAPGTRITKKRQPIASIPDRLAAHLCRWRRLDGDGQSHVVNYNGKELDRQKGAFRAACRDAGLGDDVIPHTLRHTAITWLMQAGLPINEVSSFAGVTVEELQRTYWHHHPDFQQKIRGAKLK